MKKLLFSLFLLFTVPSIVFADATPTSTLNPKSAKLDYMSGGAVAVTDQSTGYTQRVYSEGAALVQEYPKEVTTVSGKDAAAVSSACRVYGIICASTLSSAGDKVDIYDAASATGTPKFECSMGTAKETVVISIPAGTDFDTGVYVDQSADNVLVSVIYDN